MTHYPQGKQATAKERETTFPTYSDADEHPFWRATPLCESDKVAAQSAALNVQLEEAAILGTMGAPLRMWNTATTTIPLGNVIQYRTAAPYIDANAPVLPFGQVSMDQQYPFPPGAQRHYGFA